MITGHGDVDMAVECMKRGAADFIQKTVNLRELKVRLEKALERAGLSERVIRLEQELAIVEPRELIGESKGIQEIRNLIAAVARDGSISVLILGETGTGKEVVARAIHATGGRSRKPFVAVSLAVLPTSTIESELFGYERGAFTGAERPHMGLIERANGGVLFLDEFPEFKRNVLDSLRQPLEDGYVVVSRVTHWVGLATFLSMSRFLRQPMVILLRLSSRADFAPISIIDCASARLPSLHCETTPKT